MKQLLFLLACLILMQPLEAQTVEETYSKTLWCPNDTFVLKFSNYHKYFPYSVSRADKSSPGSNAEMDGYVSIYYGKDSVRLNYHNHAPYAHIFYVDLASPLGKTRLRIHLNELRVHYPKAYTDKNRGTARFDIPEAWELANIIWLLSPSGQRSSDLNRTGYYYQKVLGTFSPYLKHPLLKHLDFPDSLRASKYYDFRENSFAFNFTSDNPDSTALLYNGPYYFVWGDELADSSVFGKLKPLVEDFARVSKFRRFYKNNREFYEKEIQREKELVPVRDMQNWLEKEFPASGHDSYRIVFSPLIGGSHSTQNYQQAGFKEVVMFVCGPERIDNDRQLTEKQKEGLMSGIVFTEIDHNHVNPATRNYRVLVDSIFSRRSIWVKPGNSSGFYSDGLSVFNEYMTHAVFCLYVWEHYSQETADFIIKKREALMVEARNFIRFREFNRELMRLRQAHKDLTVAALYPSILSWCRPQQ